LFHRFFHAGLVAMEDGVLIPPGQMQLTRILSFANSSAAERVRLTTPPSCLAGVPVARNPGGSGFP